MTKLLDHAEAFYQELELQAVNDVFVGYLSKVFNKLDISRTYYTKVRAVLVNSGCIVIEVVGNAHQPSIIKLNGLCSREELAENISAEPLTDAGRYGSLLASVRDVGERFASLEKWREQFGEVNITEVLRDFERRLSRLETLLTQLPNQREVGESGKKP